MKTKELMLGDLVRLTDGRIAKVVAIDTTGNIDVEFETEHFCHHVKAHEEDIEPIPLTKDFLLKNGFKKYNENLLGLTITLNSGISYDRRSKFFDYQHLVKGRVMSDFVAEAHQFQHFLRMCGLDELANILKI